MFKVLVDGCEPTRGSKYSAFVDLYASEDCVIGAGETKIVGLGVCIDETALKSLLCDVYREPFIEKGAKEFLKSHYLQLEPRSSLRAKGLIVGTGIIDLDYKDEIKLIVHNTGSFNTVEFDRLKNGKSLAEGIRIENVSDIDLAYDEAYNTFYKDEDRHQYTVDERKRYFKIKKGDKIAQIALMEHKSYLMGYESKEERNGGLGSTGN